MEVFLPEILKIALDNKIISICASFFNALPKLTYLKLIKNYANKLSRFDTQYFHYDENAIKLLKVFVYLNDVNNNTEGPFCYVRKSILMQKTIGENLLDIVTLKLKLWKIKKI